MVGALEMIVFAIAEVREGYISDFIVILLEDQRHLEVQVLALVVFSFQVPLALLTPTEPDGAKRHGYLAGLRINGDSLPFRIVFLAEIFREVGCPELPIRNVLPVFLHQTHQHGHVGILAAILFEVLRLTIEMELAQDDMPHRHGKGCIRALLGVQPHVGEFRGFRIVGRNHD